MIIEDVRNRVQDVIDYTEREIKANYNRYKKDDPNNILSQVNGQELGQLILNKSVLENLKLCLEPDNEHYNCFAAIKPILEKLYPNKKDWLPVYGFLLSKAKKFESNYSITDRYLKRVEGKNYSRSIDNVNDKLRDIFTNDEDSLALKNVIFLDNIVNDNGDYLPYILNNYDRFLLQAIGLDYDDVVIISKKCRSLYKEENRLKEQEQKPIKGTRKVNMGNLEADIKAKKAKLHYLRTIISVDTYEVITDKMISNEEAANIISLMEELEFEKDRIEFVKNQIIKFNKKVAANELSCKIVQAKEELFTNEMFDKYEVALTTILDSNIVYSYLKENIESEIKYIDSIVLDYVNQKENKEDTCEYLTMAFEDLNESLKLCGPSIIRKK